MLLWSVHQISGRVGEAGAAHGDHGHTWTAVSSARSWRICALAATAARSVPASKPPHPPHGRSTAAPRRAIPSPRLEMARRKGLPTILQGRLSCLLRPRMVRLMGRRPPYRRDPVDAGPHRVTPRVTLWTLRRGRGTSLPVYPRRTQKDQHQKPTTQRQGGCWQSQRSSILSPACLQWSLRSTCAPSSG